MTEILIVDDDKEIRTLLKLLLSSANYSVTEAENGEEALALLRVPGKNYSLVLLDVAMPGKDGFETGEGIRKLSNIPILYLTARGQEYDKIMGFAAGGDDYLIKPFVSSELLARVGALIRRYLRYGTGVSENRILSVGNLSLDEDTRKVTVAGESKKLTAKEYEILALLCRTRGKVFSANNIYDSVWARTAGSPPLM